MRKKIIAHVKREVAVKGTGAVGRRRQKVSRPAKSKPPAIEGDSIACPHCRKTFKTAWYAEVHAESCPFDSESADAAETQRYRCAECCGSYSNAHSYKAHFHYCKGRNGPDQAHACQLCEATFGRLHDLKRHVELTHNRVKRLTCHLCFKPFGRTSHLRRHVEVVHREARMCCNKVKWRELSTAGDVGQDQQSATGGDEQSGPILCPFVSCGLEMQDVSELQSHLAQHSGIDSADEAEVEAPSPAVATKMEAAAPPVPDPFMCPLNTICHSSFSRYNHLVRHLSTTHAHLFKSDGRRLLSRCSSLRRRRGRRANRKTDNRELLRRSAMDQNRVEVAFDSLFEN